LERYQGKSADKSHVPKSIRRLVAHEVAMMDDIHHGPRQAKLNGAHIDRDWSKVHAGDWYQADDVTFPVYYYEPDGKGWFTLWRGQCLVMIDLRTLCVLSFVLISSRNYNSKAIRTLITRTADEHGLPRRGFYFEQGIWKSSRLLVGKKDDPLAFSDAEAEKGLKDIGLEFLHSLSPRGKPVDRVLGLHQNQMEREPGYVGRNEVMDRFERVQKHKLAVESRKLHPAGYFLSVDEWTERLIQIFGRYNAEIQQGKMLNGLSPEQGFSQLQDPSNPPVKFDARCRFLLSHHRRPVRITRNGIQIQIGKEAFVYRNAETGRHIGRDMLAWWNPETPEVLCVTDMNRENVFAVERAESVPALDATEEEMGEAMAQINAHGSYARERYRVVKAKLQPIFRTNAVSRDVSLWVAKFRKRPTRSNGRRPKNAGKAGSIEASIPAPSTCSWKKSPHRPVDMSWPRPTRKPASNSCSTIPGRHPPRLWRMWTASSSCSNPRQTTGRNPCEHPEPQERRANGSGRVCLVGGTRTGPALQPRCKPGGVLSLASGAGRSLVPPSHVMAAARVGRLHRRTRRRLPGPSDAPLGSRRAGHHFLAARR
jgi:hypothetical protein